MFWCIDLVHILLYIHNIYIYLDICLDRLLYIPTSANIMTIRSIVMILILVTIFFLYATGQDIYIYGPASLGTSPPPTPWLWVCIVAPQYPPPPCGVGGGGWWCTPLPPVVWVVVGGGGGGGGGRSCICMYMNVSVPPSPLWCGWCGWWWVVVRSCICMYMNVYDGMNVYF